MPNRFKNPTGNYYTSQLFYERWVTLSEDQRSIQPVFNLSGDTNGLIDAQRTFVETGDWTGYRWVAEYLDGDYNLWRVLQKSAWFRDALTLWREELEVKWASEALDRIRLLASDEDTKRTPRAVQLSACKYLDKREYKSKATTRGRPSKQEINSRLKEEAREAKSLQDDMARIRGLSP